MGYRVKEIFLTLQGEGAQSGRVAVFCRFAGCNLWSGREEDRAGAACDFCDTDFVGVDGPGGGAFDGPEVLADRLATVWRRGTPGHGLAGVGDGDGAAARPCVVFTGGEPMLQLDGPLIDACHARGLDLALETNGTLPVPGAVDWVTVSPKAGCALVQTRGDELKVVWPQGLDLAALAGLDFEHRTLQPMHGPRYAEHLAATIEACARDPRWRLGLQAHKLVGLP